MELADGSIGAEASYKLELAEGKLKISVMYDGAGADASMSVSLEADYFLDKLAELIPGQIDDAIFVVLKGALK